MGREAGGKERDRLPRGKPRKLGGPLHVSPDPPLSFRPFGHAMPRLEVFLPALLTISSFRASSKLAL